MIEVLLALTVIAIGMTSVLGLFPVGLNASRNAVAQNCSADVAEQLITYFRVVNELDKRTSGSNYDSNFINNQYSITKYSTESDLNDDSEKFLDDYKAENVSPTSTTFPRISSNWAVFKTKTSSLENKVFFVVQGPNCTKDTGSRPIDFSAMALIWKEPAYIKRLKSGGNPAVPADWEQWPTTASYQYSAKLNIELSWPLELPYNERKKRYYQIIIKNPNQ